MKKLGDTLNKKSKAEQLFLLVLMFTAMLAVLCITGCGGGKSCEKPQCGTEEYAGAKAVGCSIPGCGGCLTSGKGCSTPLWPQSCKLVHFSAKELDDSADQRERAKITACDARYYGDGCLGCGQIEKTCYSGCISVKSDSMDVDGKGFFYGSTDSNEKVIGCYNGCGGCVNFDDNGWDMMYEFESRTGVD